MEGGGRNEYKKGLWTVEEDRILMDYISVHGSGKWNRIAKVTGLKRGGKSCRLRWVNYLSPTVKQGDFSEEEDDLIIRLHKLLGNRWSLIAGRVPGRTDNQVKNHWNTHLSKKLGVNKGKSKARASSRPIFSRALEGNFCVPSESSSDDHQQLQATTIVNVNGTTEADHEGEKAIKDGSQNGVWFTGMWEMLMGDNVNNYETSFYCSSDEFNLHTSYLLEPLQEYCSLDFVWDGL